MATKQPTKEQVEALWTFRKANGRYWKMYLRHCWESGLYSTYPGTQRSDLLQQVRNGFGPSWLTRIDLNNLNKESA